MGTMSANVETLRQPKARGHLYEVGTVSNPASYSHFDSLLIFLGAKMSPATKTSPLEWNGKVVALLGGLLSMFVVCGGLIWYAASLASQVSFQDKQIQKMEVQLDKIEQYQRDADLKSEAARGFKMGVAESETKPKEK